MVLWGACPFMMLTCEQRLVGMLSSLDLADRSILVFPIGETYRCNILGQYKASSSVYSYISIPIPDSYRLVNKFYTESIIVEKHNRAGDATSKIYFEVNTRDKRTSNSLLVPQNRTFPNPATCKENRVLNHEPSSSKD